MESPARQRFLAINKEISDLYMERREKRFVYVDLMHNNLGYLLRSLYIGRAAAIITGCDLVGIGGNPGVVKRSAYLDPAELDIELAASFGVTRVIFAPTYDLVDTREGACLADHHAAPDYLSARMLSDKIEEIQQISDNDGFQLGRIVQDTFMRSHLLPTLLRCPALHSTFEEVELLGAWFRELFENNPPEAFVSGHIDYSPWGLAMQRCMAAGGKSIYYRCDVRTPIYVLGEMDRNETLNGLLRKADKKAYYDYRHRFSLPRKSLDIRHSLNNSVSKNWRWVEHPSDHHSFEWPFNNGLPTACLFTHTFTDQPSADKSAFVDHLHWLEQTLDHARKRSDYNLFVKIHPLDGFFDLTAAIDRLSDKYQDSKNIVFVRSPVPAELIVRECKLGITVRGTPALEFSALGLRMLLAGRAYFDHVGSITYSQSPEEYFSYLEDFLFNPQPMIDSYEAKSYVSFDRYWAAPHSSLLGSFDPHQTAHDIWANALHHCASTAFEIDDITQSLAEAFDTCDRQGFARAFQRRSISFDRGHN